MLLYVFVGVPACSTIGGCRGCTISLSCTARARQQQEGGEENFGTFVRDVGEPLKLTEIVVLENTAAPQTRSKHFVRHPIPMLR